VERVHTHWEVHATNISDVTQTVTATATMHLTTETESYSQDFIVEPPEMVIEADMAITHPQDKGETLSDWGIDPCGLGGAAATLDVTYTASDIDVTVSYDLGALLVAL
jgi:hypothetical protein